MRLRIAWICNNGLLQCITKIHQRIEQILADAPDPGAAASLASLRREVEPVDPVTLARFLTDWQGDILDTAGRPLSSFQDDPRPASVMVSSSRSAARFQNLR